MGRERHQALGRLKHLAPALRHLLGAGKHYPGAAEFKFNQATLAEWVRRLAASRTPTLFLARVVLGIDVDHVERTHALDLHDRLGFREGVVDMPAGR